MKKSLIGLMAIIAFCGLSFAANKAKEPRKPVVDSSLTELGRHKFLKTADYRKVTGFAEFAVLASGTYAKDIQIGLEQVQASELYEPLIAYFKTHASAIESDIPNGTTFEWMFFRKNGQVYTMAKPIWTGKDKQKNPVGFAAYVFELCFNGNRYTLVAPKACYNLSLLKKEPYQAACNMVIKKEGECAKVGEVVTIDLSASTGLSELNISVSPEGADVKANGENIWTVTFPSTGEYTISATGKACSGEMVTCQAETVKVVLPLECQVSVSPACTTTGKPIAISAITTAGKLSMIAVKNAAGTVVYEKQDPTSPIDFTAQEPGTYYIEAQATGDCNQIKTAKSELRFEKPIESPVYLLGEAGFMLAKGTYSSYIYPRVGAGLWLADRILSLEILPGAGISLTDLPFYSFFMIDARLALHPGQGYIAAGIGLSSKVRDAEPGLATGVWKSDFDLSLAAGLYLTQARTLSIIGEFRLPVATGVPVEYNHAFSLGLRYTFQLNSNTDPCAKQ